MWSTVPSHQGGALIEDLGTKYSMNSNFKQAWLYNVRTDKLQYSKLLGDKKLGH